jgi:hypothetical protein
MSKPTIDSLDYEKLQDVKKLSKKQFLQSYSYLAEKEYNKLKKDLPFYNHIIKKLKKDSSYCYFIKGKRLIHFFNKYKQFEKSKIRIS